MIAPCTGTWCATCATAAGSPSTARTSRSTASSWFEVVPRQGERNTRCWTHVRSTETRSVHTLNPGQVFGGGASAEMADTAPRLRRRVWPFQVGVHQAQEGGD